VATSHSHSLKLHTTGVFLEDVLARNCNGNTSEKLIPTSTAVIYLVPRDRPAFPLLLDDEPSENHNGCSDLEDGSHFDKANFVITTSRKGQANQPTPWYANGILIIIGGTNGLTVLGCRQMKMCSGRPIPRCHRCSVLSQSTYLHVLTWRV